MDAATIWVGNAKELGAPEHAAKREAFLDKGDTLLVETRGENGVEISTRDFQQAFPGVPVRELFNIDINETGTAGCGNGVEGATILHALGLSVGNTKTDKLNWLGAAANATAGAAATFKGTTLRPEHVPLIKKGFKHLTGYTPR